MTGKDLVPSEQVKTGLLPTPPMPEGLPKANLTENARKVLMKRYVRRNGCCPSGFVYFAPTESCCLEGHLCGDICCTTPGTICRNGTCQGCPEGQTLGFDTCCVTGTCCFGKCCGDGQTCTVDCTTLETITETVDPSNGGTLNSSDGGVTINFMGIGYAETVQYTSQAQPSHALPEDTQLLRSFTLTTLTAMSRPQEVEFVFYTMRVRYTEATLAAMDVESEFQLQLLWWDATSSSWMPAFLPEIDRSEEEGIVTQALLGEFALVAGEENPSEISATYLPLEITSPTLVERRCDGIEMDDGSPCKCNAEGEDKCVLITRLTVALPELTTMLGWRLETKGDNAARELLASMDLVRGIAGGRPFVPAKLRIVERRGQRERPGRALRRAGDRRAGSLLGGALRGARKWVTRCTPRRLPPLERPEPAGVSLADGLQVAETQTVTRTPRSAAPLPVLDEDIPFGEAPVPVEAEAEVVERPVITQAQRARLFGIEKEYGVSMEHLRDLVKEMTGSDSTAGMTIDTYDALVALIQSRLPVNA